MDATATGHWRKLLKDLPDRELFDLRDAVADVVKHPGWEQIVGLITTGRDGVLKSLTQGATRSHEGYARQVGYLAGLEEAPNVVQAISDAASQREKEIKRQVEIADRNRQGESP